MIGPVLNLLNSLYKDTEVLSKTSPYSKTSDIFGNGTLDISITKDTTLEDLYNKYKTLEFHNITIASGVKLKPKAAHGRAQQTLFGTYYYDTWKSNPTDYHPLYLKCSGTLTVNGELTSQGCGGKAKMYEGTATFYQDVSSPISLVNVNNGAGGQSADPVNFVRLMEYGKNGGFFKFEPLMLVGAGGGGNHHYSKKHIHKTKHYDNYTYMRGFAAGGDTPGSDTNSTFGCAGGFLALYFSDLIIDGIPYGTAGCDITKISANGYYDRRYFNENAYGGGCLVISARKIIVGKNGTINSDGDGGCEYTVFAKNGRAYTAGRNGGSGGIKPSFLNNIPATTQYQGGSLRWDEADQRYKIASGNGTYYFDDGSGYGVPTSYMSYNTSSQCGGAGVVLGYKIIETKEQVRTIIQQKEISYYGWIGYRTPYYAWINTTYSPGNVIVAYTDSTLPDPGDFLVGTTPTGFNNQITQIGDNTITILTTLGAQYTFTRNIAYDNGPSLEDRFVIYTKTTAPLSGTKTYDAPNNTITGYVSGIQKIDQENYISDGVRWFKRNPSADQNVLE